jgi:lipooligosaccharide transport system permease protein
MQVPGAVATGPVASMAASPRRGALALRALGYWLSFYRRTWRSSLVSGFLSPLLYLGSLGFGLGTLVHQGVGGVPYVWFVAPGVLTANAMQTAVSESTYPVMAAIKWQRQYHAMLAGPLGVVDILLGHLLYILFRTALVTIAFLLVGMLLGAFPSGWVLLAFPVAVLCGGAHATPVMAFSAAQESDGGFALLFRFGLIPMFLFAGTFFPISQLPLLVRVLARLTPLWHATELSRDLAMSRVDLLTAAGHLSYLMLWLLAGLRLAARSYRRRLTV